jgi:amino acid adenylation domain-containing protein
VTIISGLERGQLTLDTASPFVHRLVERWAAASPATIAVADGDIRLSYGELDRQANMLAHELVSRGIGVESRVAVNVPRSAGFVVAALAVLKAGAAYVPVDPGYPGERQEFMLADSGSDLVLRTASGTSLADRPELVMEGLLGHSGGNLPAGPPAVAHHPGQLAYLIYTSGSTGTPKAVAVTHADVTDLLISDQRLTVLPGQVVAHLAPTAFDASTFEIWAALTAGARIEVIADGRLSAHELGARLRSCRPDWLFLTTGLFHLIVDADPDALRSVGVLIAGGDVLSPRHVQRAASLVADRLYAAYGPTETTVFASLHEVCPQPAAVLSHVPLGSVLTGKTMRVLGDDLTELPAGELGQIYIGGAGLARGYHGRPGLTAQRFVADPYSASPGARLYRTGDRGRRLPNGDLQFCGRDDRQVKLRGFRIELGEIEAMLAAHPMVGAQAVVAVTEESGKRLVAYTAPSGTGELRPADLRSWLAARLPDYMLPGNYVLLDALPLDPNGKVDRRALPAAWTARATLDGRGLPPFVAPNGPVPRLIAEAFVDSLGIDEVGVDDNFFMLGGDSLRSVRALEHMRENGLVVSARDFFRHPTVAQLAELIALADSAAAP